MGVSATVLASCISRHGRPPIHPLRTIFDVWFRCAYMRERTQAPHSCRYAWPSPGLYMSLPLICTMGKGLGACSPDSLHCTYVSREIWADAAYRGQELAAWCQAEGGWERARGRAHARPTRLQYFTQTVGGGANTALDFAL